MTTKRIWILGAADPEMERIEALLRSCGERVEHAEVGGVRVHPGNAYRADSPRLRGAGTIYAVECDWQHDGETGNVVRIDHHRPGDPGFGVPPEDFLRGSSIGQVISLLARLGRIPREWPSVPLAWNESVGDLVETLGDWAVCVAPAAPGWSGDADYREPAAARLIPQDIVLAAAADHCLAAAYRGECPGVDPDALMEWRAETRAAFQQRPVERVLADVERAREALRRAPRLDLAAPVGSRAPYSWDADEYADWEPEPDWQPVEVRDMRRAHTVRTTLVHPFTACATVDAAGVGDGAYVAFGDYREGTFDEGGHVRCVIRGVPDLPEAAAREGIAFLAQIQDRDGRQKVVLQCASPEQLAAWPAWAERQGLVDLYGGDPARGFAGGYLP